MKQITSTSLLLFTLFFLNGLSLFAQSASPCIPIDGGITALLAVGASYGIKKIYDSKKK